MLILVAVTINMAVNGGLFGYAGNATKDTELEKNKELELANLSSGMATDDLIEKYTAVEVHNWTRSGDTFTCSHCDLEVEIGQTVEYTPDIVVAPSTVSGADSGVTQAIAKGSFNAANFGEEGSQQIFQESLTWVVLGIEDQDGNGINETLLITSCNPTNTEIVLYGADEYNNGPTIMNKVCKDLYSSSTYGKSRNITIEDVNKAVNWTDTRGIYYDTNNNAHKVNANTKFSDLPADVKSAFIANGTNTPDGTSLDNYNIDGYFYMMQNNNLVDQITTSEFTSTPITPKERIVIFGNNNNYKYWLASRSSMASFNGIVRFGPGIVSSALVKSDIECYGSDGSIISSLSSPGFPLRPVVPLRSNIPTIVPLPEDPGNSSGGGQ